MIKVKDYPINQNKWKIIPLTKINNVDLVCLVGLEKDVIIIILLMTRFFGEITQKRKEEENRNRKNFLIMIVKMMKGKIKRIDRLKDL